MKFCIILATLIGLTLATRIKPNDFCNGEFYRNTIAKCAEEHDATQDDIEDYIYLRWAASQKAKCFRACVFEGCKAFNSDGSFVANAPQTTGFLTSRQDPSLWIYGEEEARKCMAIKLEQNNLCEKTEAFMRCFPAKSPVPLSLIGAYCDNLIEENNLCKK
ncbi:general odorant-binding protein 28a-like [Musca autumnalis]|uniref:general odorant-binding protein 28a-like n=1 Tax=Musca autumnalis TaxID=221902 RepID=UPI003CE89F60